MLSLERSNHDDSGTASRALIAESLKISHVVVMPEPPVQKSSEKQNQ
jgi:hypothetical protein